MFSFSSGFFKSDYTGLTQIYNKPGIFYLWRCKIAVIGDSCCIHGRSTIIICHLSPKKSKIYSSKVDNNQILIYTNGFERIKDCIKQQPSQ